MLVQQLLLAFGSHVRTSQDFNRQWHQSYAFRAIVPNLVGQSR